jgi:hypothetical protein
LHLALALEAPLPRRLVVDEQQSTYGVRREDFDGGHPADPPVGRVYPRGHAQVLFQQLPERPTARDRRARPVLGAAPVVCDAVARAEQVGDLVVPVARDRFLERHDVRTQLAEAVDEDLPALLPRSVAPPQVERGDARHARPGLFFHGEPPRSVN